MALYKQYQSIEPWLKSIQSQKQQEIFQSKEDRQN
jgi:succinate dehydrogenase/fumarate reductase-like Fe-S protein